MNEESLSSNECLVRVRAQVMARDDSTGGWRPVGGGGLSYVGLRKISCFVSDALPTKSKMEFVITGHRISDDLVCLNCVMRKELQYNQVTPTFRHWQIRDQKFGLTFQSATDAKAFDLAVERAMEDIKNFSPEPSPKSERNCGQEGTDPVRVVRGRPSNNFLPKPMAHRRPASPQLSNMSVPSRVIRAQPQATPAKRLLSLPNPPMTKSLSSPLHQPTHHPGPVAVRLSTSLLPSTPRSTMTTETSSKELSTPLVSLIPNASDAMCGPEKYTYVDVISNKSGDGPPESLPDPPSGPHDYSYPSFELVSKQGKRDSISSIKMHNLDMMSSHRPPLLPIKNKRKRSRKRDNKSKHVNRSERSRCKYCHEFYWLDSNERGACEFAPDKAKTYVDRLSCIPTASGILYHCTSDSDGEYSNHPCNCDTGSRSCFGRWLALAMLSFILPCLCCYYPLKGCHKLGLACGLCGGRHEAMDLQQR